MITESNVYDTNCQTDYIKSLHLDKYLGSLVQSEASGCLPSQLFLSTLTIQFH